MDTLNAVLQVTNGVISTLQVRISEGLSVTAEAYVCERQLLSEPCIVFLRRRRACFGRLAMASANPLAFKPIHHAKKTQKSNLCMAQDGGGGLAQTGRSVVLLSWPLLIIMDAHKANLILFQINKDAMERALSSDMLATDLANYLVRKGVSIQRLGRNGRGLEVFVEHLKVASFFCIPVYVLFEPCFTKCTNSGKGLWLSR